MPARKRPSSNREEFDYRRDEEDAYWEQNRSHRARGDFAEDSDERRPVRRAPYRTAYDIRAGRRIDRGHESAWEFYNPEETLPEETRDKRGRTAERIYPSRFAHERRRERLERSEGGRRGYDFAQERDREERFPDENMLAEDEFDDERRREGGYPRRTHGRDEGEYRDEERHFGRCDRSRFIREPASGRRMGDWFEDERYLRGEPIRGDERMNQPRNRTRASRARKRAHTHRRRSSR